MKIFKKKNFYKDQILLVDKPWGWSSFQVVKQIKFLIKKKKLDKIKVGHTGTLDPLSTGLLIILIGKSNKKNNIFQKYRKTYTGIIKIGCETLSLDSENQEINFHSIANITDQSIMDISKKFIGKIDQIPPYFSAIKINGKKLYHYALNKEKVYLKPRLVEIYQFKILKISNPYIKFFIECGKGTYIRSIARDFGNLLNNKAYLLSLRRESIGNFSIKNPKNLIKIDDLSNDFISYLPG